MKRIGVIGSGIAGITTAYSLAKRGHKVTLIDARRYPAMATSYANGGQLSASNAETWNTSKNLFNGIKWMFQKDAPLLFNPTPNVNKYKWMLGFLAATFSGKHKSNTLKTIDMAKKAREHYFKIADDEKIEFNLLKKGLLHIYDNENELQAAREKKNWIEQDGMEWDYLDLDEIEDLEPAFKTDKNTKKIVGGIYTKSDASGDIHKFCVNLHKVLEDKYKLVSKFNSEVETIYKEKDCVIVSISDGNITEGLEFDKVAICAGVDTQKFANVLGDRMQVYPVKGYSVTINLNDQVSQEAAPKVSLIDDPVKIVSSRLGNRLRVAGTAELAGYNKDIRQDRVRPLLNWVKKYFPDVSTESYTPWAGLRPMTPDMMPLLFESNLGDIFYNTGHGHLGWTLSSETAEILAKKILNEI